MLFIMSSAHISIFGSLAVAVIVGVLSYFIFVRSFQTEWFGPDGAEKLKLNSVDQKLGSEYTDSGYHERIKKLDEKPGVSGIQQQKPSDKPGCFQQELILIFLITW